MVDLIGQATDMRGPASTTFGENDLVLAEVPGLEWLANSPRVEAVTAVANGVPVLMSLCDPRAFSIHKAWLSEQSERDPVKKPRDFNQAVLVAEMVVTYLPQFPFDASAIKYLPANLPKRAAKEIEQASGIRLPGMDF